ncbi:MAG: hypothetical protein E7050_08175 [Lentisphaerae bacterium]|nr:hypothetical protein [Lentisphaerota bacterium]
MKHFSVKIMFFLVALMLGSGPLLRAETTKRVAPVSIDEKNIVNKTGVRNANFAPLLDTVKTEFFQTGYAVVDMNDLAEVLKHSDVVSGVNGTDNGDFALDFPGYILRISVIKYGFSDIVRRNYARGSRKNIVNCEVSISVHVVQVKSGAGAGQTVGSCIASSKKTVEVDGRGQGNFNQSILQDCNIEVAKDLVRQMEKYIPAKFRPAPVTVYQVKGDRIYLFTPGRRLAENTVFDVFDAEILGDGDDREIIPGDFAGRIQVVKSMEKYTICRLIVSGIGIRKGMIATPASGAKKHSSSPAPERRQNNIPF